MESTVPAALVVLAAVALSLGYLLPHLVRRLHELSEAPNEDRFSEAARVIEPPTAHTAAKAAPSTAALLGAAPSVRTESMNRPTIRPGNRPVLAAGPGLSGESASAPARPAASTAKAKASPSSTPSRVTQPAAPAAVLSPADVARAQATRATRLRGALALAFALLTVLAVVLWATRGLTLWAAAATACFTGAVVVSGRRAVVAASQPGTGRPSQGLKAWLGLGQGTPAVAASVPDAVSTVEAVPVAGVAAPAAAGVAQTVRDQAIAAHPASGYRPVAAATAAKPAVAEAGGVPVGARRPAGRRPGVSGRIQGGHHTVALPPPLDITEVDLAALSAGLTEPLSPEETIVLAEAAAEAQQIAAAEQAAAAAGAGGWTPTLAPAPVYTLSSEAAHWEPKALSDQDYEAARQAALRATDAAVAQARAAGLDESETPTGGLNALPPRVIFTEGAIDLDRAMETRRRAVGG